MEDIKVPAVLGVKEKAAILANKLHEAWMADHPGAPDEECTKAWEQAYSVCLQRIQKHENQRPYRNAVKKPQLFPLPPTLHTLAKIPRDN